MNLLSLAVELAARIAAEAAVASAPVSITVVDGEGQIVLQHRLDGAPAGTLVLSERKAYTAALVRRRTDELARPEAEAPDYAATAVGGGRYSVIAGGVPLVIGGEVLGGVGVCGATPDGDVLIIDAALVQLVAARTWRPSGHGDPGAEECSHVA